jgi:hypothetical protein
MTRFVAALLLAAAATCALSAEGPDADPLNSTECAAARDELDKALSEPAERQRARPERLARARQQATRVCLGRDSGNRERSGAPQPVQAVPPAAISVRPAPPTPAPPQPPLAIPRATVITTCDPAGCWDSEGHRLNNVGPLLMGPRGLCTIQGGLLNCP